jgi:hypothetical protein
MNNKPQHGEILTHFKGGRYFIDTLASLQVEGMENVEAVIYIALKDEKTYVRTLVNFTEMVAGRGPNGEDVPRFSRE